MKRSDAAVSVILIGLAGFILLESRHLSFGTMRVPQTAFFPKILAVLLLIFSGIALLQALIGPRIRQAALEPLAAEGWIKNRRDFGSDGGFAFVLERAGFFLTTFLLMVLLLRAIEAQRWSKVIGIAVATALISYAIFGWLLGIHSPHRHLGNLRWISSPMSRSASRSHSRRQICSFAFSDPWSARWSAYCRAWVQSARSRFCCH